MIPKFIARRVRKRWLSYREGLRCACICCSNGENYVQGVVCNVCHGGGIMPGDTWGDKVDECIERCLEVFGIEWDEAW